MKKYKTQNHQKRCEWCNKELPDDAQKETDPFLSEIYDDNTLMYICDKCYDKRHEEV